MITKIGIVAGEIWHFLDNNGSTSFSSLVGKLEQPKETLLMSLGWLAREGHVLLEGEENFTIDLRKNQE